MKQDGRVLHLGRWHRTDLLKLLSVPFLLLSHWGKPRPRPWYTKPMEETEWKKLTDCRRTQDLEGSFPMMPLLFSSCCLDADLVFPHVCQNWVMKPATQKPQRHRCHKCRETFLTFSTRHPSGTEHFTPWLLSEARHHSINCKSKGRAWGHTLQLCSVVPQAPQRQCQKRPRRRPYSYFILKDAGSPDLKTTVTIVSWLAQFLCCSTA